MIILTYGANKEFEECIGDKYYCKTFASAKIKLKEVLEQDIMLKGKPDLRKEVLEKYTKWHKSKTQQFSVGDDNINVGELFILLEEIILD